MNDANLSALSPRLSATLSRLLLRYGQAPARVHHGALALWLLCIATLLLAFWIWPAHERIDHLEARLRAGTLERRGLDERLREAQILSHALRALPTAQPQPARDPWPFLQALAQARSVQLIDYTPLLDYTPLAASSHGDCQPLRVKMLGASSALQGLLQDLLRSPQSVERFTLTPDASGATTLALQICQRDTESPPIFTRTPRTALFEPAPKVARRPRTALEEHPLADYRVIAIGRAEHTHYALVRTPAGKIHPVRRGMRLGDRSAPVLAIHPNGIEVQQDRDRLSLLIGSPP